MNEADRLRFESDHFESLTAERKLAIAEHDFESGIAPTGERAVIIDHALGNGDGVFNDQDLKLIEEKKNDTQLMSALGQTSVAITEVATASVGYQLGASGALSSFFNSSSGAEPEKKITADLLIKGMLSEIFMGGADPSMLKKSLDAPEADQTAPPAPKRDQMILSIA